MGVFDLVKSCYSIKFTNFIKKKHQTFLALVDILSSCGINIVFIVKLLAISLKSRIKQNFEKL